MVIACFSAGARVLMKKLSDTVIQRRIAVVLLFFFVLLGALLARLFILQVAYHKDYKRLAERQHKFVKELLPERGGIFAKDKKDNSIPLALNRTYKTIIAAPKDIRNKEETIAWLVKNFNIEADTLLKKLSKSDDPHEILLKKVDPERVKELDKESIAGIFFADEKRRLYPHGELAAHLLGFVSQEVDQESGKYGIERFYEKELMGKKGIFEGSKDAAGFWIALGRQILNPPRNGADTILTLDYNIQRKSEEILKAIREKWRAESGTVLVVDPNTGRILALAAEPTFNPNEFGKEKNFSVFLNPAIELSYELGSVMKPVTLIGGLEEGLISPDSTYMDGGEVKIGGYTIKNFDEKAYKIQTMTQVLEKSLNTGAVYAAKVLGKKKQHEYIKKFGMGEKTGIDLPGEVAGNISNLDAGRDIDFATASFGQGIAVTPIQMAMAISAIANGGKLMKPYVVEKIIEDSGNKVEIRPQIVRNAVSREAAEKMTKMLVSAVRNGFENRAGVRGYFVAGKTGTAQIPRREGKGYYTDRVIHSFVGYAPAFNPRFLILLQLNEPKGNRFAANTLTPAFHNLAEYILNYYEIPPDDK